MKGNKLTRAVCQGVRTLKNDSTTILTVCAAVGVVGTFVTTIQATKKAQKTINQYQATEFRELSKKEKLELVWRDYIPPVIIGTSTVVCVFSANALNKKRQAELTSAYVALDQAYKEYKRRVNNTFGEDAQELIFKKTVEEDIKNGLDGLTVNEKDCEDDILIYDEFSRQYFWATDQELIKAENHLNGLLNWTGDVSLDALYSSLHIPTPAGAKDSGWTWAVMGDYDDGFGWFDGTISLHPCHAITDDGIEAYILLMDPLPMYDHLKYEG